SKPQRTRGLAPHTGTSAPIASMSETAEGPRPAWPNPPAVILGHESSLIAQPSTFLLPRGPNRAMQDKDKPLSAVDKDQQSGLKAIRDFLKIRTSYDVLPLSFRLIILNTDLLVKKSLNILLQNGIVSAPLWDSHTSSFAGLLTTSDYINVVQYYWQNPDALNAIDQFRLSSLRDVEKAINVLPLETLSVHPARPLYEACTQMLKTRARRIPLVDIDDETGREMVVSVITQYRILKFIAVNVVETEMLKKSVSELGLGTYGHLQTASMDTTVIDVIHMMVDHSISSVPILDEEKHVLNVFEAVDVISIIKGGVYDDLGTSVGDALSKRAEDFAGIYTCSEEDRLDSLFDTIRKSRVHRLVVIDEENRLKGVISLSDILKYVLLHGAEDE
ncbi:5'-AMP-activated protein kinase subunit gamma, partial [Lachnellula arida]